MSDLDRIVEVVISRQTQAVSQTGFGVPLISDEFATSKTTPAFSRYRTYTSLEEMISEGWVTGDAIYQKAAKILAQNPKVSKFAVGRRDSGDADWATALGAIQTENADWYTFSIVPDQTSPATIIADTLQAAAWAETQKKIFFGSSIDTDIYDSGVTSDIASQLKALNYDRSVTFFHATANEYIEDAAVGEALPFDPGSQTWAYKTLTGVAADQLSSSQKQAVLDKNANTYTTVSGVSITEQGQVASGEFIDIIRGIDWVQSRLQEAVFSELVNKRKIPYTDAGITLIQGTVEGVLNEAVRLGILQADSVVVTVPKYADIPQNDRINRHLPDVKFTALLEGAIHTVKINGTVTV
jgi:hypothetical protein